MALFALVLMTFAWSWTDGYPPPSEGLALLPDPEIRVEQASPWPSLPAPPRMPPPTVPISAAAAAAAAGGWRVRRRVEVTRPSPPPDVTVVLVGGYGSNREGSFERLVEMMGVDPGRVRSFDYRWIAPEGGHRAATRQTGVAELASALNAYLAGLGGGGRLYLVGHSKGAAIIAELVARWDRHPEVRVPGVMGTALLDPPLADGPLGLLQSAGTALGLPNDGGYDPRPWVGAPDRRVELGRRSGIEVVVFRNPKAALTSFWDGPPGLRVFDVPDAGPHALAVLVRPDPMPVRRWLRFLSRVREAHRAPLEDRRVADCLVREMREIGSCTRVPTDW